MADRVLKLKLQVDTSQTGKFAKVFQEIESSAKSSETVAQRLKELDRQRLELTAQQGLALAKLQGTVAKLNSLQEQGVLNSKLAFNAANTSVINYNNSLEKTLKLQNEIAGQKSILKGGYSFAGTAAPNKTPVNIPQEGERSRNPLTGQIIESEQQREEKLAKMREAIARTSNSVLEQQTRDRLKREEEVERQSAYNRIKNQSFAQRLNSVPRVSSQGSQIDITGTLSKYLKDQVTAQNQATISAKKHADALDDLDRKHRSLTQRIIEAVSIYRIYNFTLNSIINGIKAIPDIGIQLESTKSVLAATAGSEASVSSVLKSITTEAERSGIAVSTLREQFRTFSASATLAGETTDTAWRIFTNLNTTITSLHLSADQAQHVFLAFSQILNKGKVQSEELVKQLGNLLPGAFATMAKALGISTVELSKRMKQGLVTAHDSLDLFAQEYAKQFSQSFIVAQQGLNANIERMQTSFTLLGESIYQGTKGWMIDFVKGVRSLTDEIRFAIDGTSKWQTELHLLKEVIIGGFYLALANSISKVVAIGVNLGSMATKVTLATTAVTGLKKAFAFLSGPTAIIAGIIAIEERLRELIFPADDLITKLQKSREEAEKLRKDQETRKSLSEPEQLKFDVENSEEVKGKLSDVRKLFNELQDAKERVNKAKLNPFAYNTNDYAKDLDFIARGTEEFKKQTSELEKLREEKLLLLEADKKNAAEKAKATENTTETKEKPIKEVNFGKEIELQDSLIKKENERYKAKLAVLKLQEQQLQSDLKLNSLSPSPVAESSITGKIDSIKQQGIDLEKEHANRLLSIAKTSENIIVGSVKKTTISVQQAFEKIQDIESLGVANRDSAVSITGALGKSQVQPSTLSEYTNVPQRILDIEKQARFRLNRLGLKNTLSSEEKKELQTFALEHIKEINDAGSKLFEKLVNQFDGDYVKAAVAYNTGAARVKVASEAAKQAGREDFENFLPTSGKLALNKRGLAEAQGYARKARAAIGGTSFEPAITDQQTKQQEARDKIAEATQERLLLNDQKRVEIAERQKQIKEQEAKIQIEYLEATDSTKEAEIAKVKAEFAERYAEAERLGSEFLKQRLPVLEQQKLKQIELQSLQKQYDNNERVFNDRVQDLTNKSLVGKLKNYQAAQEIFNLQRDYIKQQEKILENELKLATTEEQRITIKDKLKQIEQQKAETAGFTDNYLTSNLAPERAQFENTNVNLGNSRTTKIDMLQQEREAGLVSEEEFQQRKQDIEDKYLQASLLNNSIYYGSLFGMASDNFAGITSAAQKMFGEQSTAARASFAMQKGVAVAQATMQTYVAATKAYAEGGPYLGPALAAVAVVAGLANVATIISQPMPSGAAHGGLENVPKESTYLLDKGERVLSPRQNVDITNKVTNIHDKITNNSGGNVKVINVVDPNLLNSYLATEEGERVVMNIVKRNQG